MLLGAIERAELEFGKRDEILDQLRSRFTSLPELLDEFTDPSKSVSLDALQWRRDASLVPLAREVFDPDGERATRRLEESAKLAADTIEFVRAKARLGALRVLFSQNDIADEDRERLDTELGSEYRLLNESVSLLLPVATQDNGGALLQVLDSTYFDQRRQVAEAMISLRRAGRGTVADGSCLRQREGFATSRIATEESTEPEVLLELLNSPIDEVRVAATEGYCSRATNETLERLIEEYPTNRESYYYSVVACLDEHLYFVPTCVPRNCSQSVSWSR